MLCELWLGYNLWFHGESEAPSISMPISNLKLVCLSLPHVFTQFTNLRLYVYNYNMNNVYFFSLNQVTLVSANQVQHQLPYPATNLSNRSNMYGVAGGRWGVCSLCWSMVVVHFGRKTISYCSCRSCSVSLSPFSSFKAAGLGLLAPCVVSN